MSETGVTLGQVEVGTALPELSIPITSSLIVGGALASRDFTPVHHDKAAAQAAGVPDIFMNILTTNGLVGRYVTDWAGPNAKIENVNIRLGTPNTPGETMKFTGQVVEMSGDTATVELSGSNSWGDHVTGTVRVALPR
ncbi:MAG: MaoC family dehydratase [Myxococcota bacterium]|nr:MaoC family dehydratase [Myxococcota bacterium]